MCGSRLTGPKKGTRWRVSAICTIALIPYLAASALGETPGARAYDPAIIFLLDRLTFGATAEDAASVQKTGIKNWLEAQLHPSPKEALPAPVQAQIDAMTISQKPMAELVTGIAAKNKALNQITDPDLKKAASQAYQQILNDYAKQAATRQILRDLYSPAQIRERMTWFWFNHFNVHQGKADIRTMVGDYEDRAIRPHALGRFRDLLEATLRHPAMLRYLDNAQNGAGHINENYAREIMELHTMGVGSGYTQQDVEELARILTGVGVDANPENPHVSPELEGQLLREGLFEFNPARHDYGDKTFLGHVIKGRGFAEVDEALDILARHPATARHIARRIAVYFVADDPPQALIDRMTEAFQHSDGDIASVLRTMAEAPEFAAAQPGKFKDPLRYVISAVRSAYDDKPILNTTPIQGWLNRMAEGLYNHQTPDGYPLPSSAWNGPGQLAVRFEIARQIGSGSAGLFKPDEPGAADQPAFPQLQNALYFGGLRQRLKPDTLAALDQAVSPQEWNALFLSSPDFMR
jgi:uncharacterized protein (DUF1800 family)